MATELLKPGTRVKLPNYMGDFRSHAVRKGEPLVGTVRGVDEGGLHYAVEFDPGTMAVGHGCGRNDGTQMIRTGHGWWFDIVPRDSKDALVPIETSKFEIAVADYVAREIGG